MASAYVGQVSPASTLTNCNYFQMADSLRWLSHTAYRTKELSLAFADKGFGEDERRYWEEDSAWQGFRELMEKALTVWDWGEAIVVLNLVVKPAIEETVLRRLGESARHNGDTLLGPHHRCAADRRGPSSSLGRRLRRHGAGNAGQQGTDAVVDRQVGAAGRPGHRCLLCGAARCAGRRRIRQGRHPRPASRPGPLKPPKRHERAIDLE